MKRFSDFIIEKLKVTSKSFDITLEELIKALKDYKDSKNYEYSVYIDLKEILEDYPIVLEYHGTNANKNIVGNEIRAIQFIQYTPVFRKVLEPGKDAVFIYFDQTKGDSIRIENTEELNDIFGEEALDEIYNYIIHNYPLYEKF